MQDEVKVVTGHILYVRGWPLISSMIEALLMIDFGWLFTITFLDSRHSFPGRTTQPLKGYQISSGYLVIALRTLVAVHGNQNLLHTS